nr:MAG TPA: hypothetical protein [Caudoviricetes sp.]
MRLRGNANNANCSARYLNANNSAANANVNNGGSAQRRASKKRCRTKIKTGESPRSGEAENIKDKGCERSTMTVRDAADVTERHPDGQTVPSNLLARH